MDLSEVISKGIEFSLVNGHDCEVTVGEEINDIIIKKADGTIVLD